MEYKKTDWKNYRQLKKGEVIKDTDEFLEDKKGWRKTICGGGLALMSHKVQPMLCDTQMKPKH